MKQRAWRGGLGALVIVGSLGLPARANFDYGTLNVSSPLVMDSGKAYFRFSHRYNVRTFPSDSRPALVLGLGILPGLGLDGLFSALDRPIEAEGALKYALFDQERGDWLSVTPRLGVTSHGGGSAIVEVAAARNDVLLPGLGIGAVWRTFSNITDFREAGYMNAVGLGVAYQILDGVNLAADVVTPLDRTVIDQNGIGWSGGLQWWIPDTPHVLSLFATNLGAGTTVGRTFAGGKDLVRVGFEFHAHFDAPFYPRPGTIKSSGAAAEKAQSD